MVQAQEWLDKWYPQEGGCLKEDYYNKGKKRNEIEILDINKQNLQGSLDLSDFSSLKTLDCSNNQLTSLNISNCQELTILNCADNPNLTNLDLDNCQKLKRLVCNKNQLKEKVLDLNKFPNLIGKDKNGDDKINIAWTTQAQTWLEENYPLEGFCIRETNDEYKYDKSKEKGWNNKGKTRQQITNLDIYGQNLEGSLDLSDFSSLKELNCSSNYLTELTVNDCLQLKKINCGWNNLSNLDWLTALSQLVKLEELNIRYNNFTTDLTWLIPLVNLKELGLSDNNFYGSLEPLTQLSKLEELNISHNPLTGSLQPLQNLTKLKSLDISDTNLNKVVSNFDKLGSNSGLEYLSDSLTSFEYRKTKAFEEELNKFGTNPLDNLKNWKRARQDQQQIQLLKIQQSEFQDQEIKINYLEFRVQELTNLIKKQKKKIVQTFLQLFPEKDLLQELIINYLELTKLRKQKLPSRKLEKKCNKFKDELEDKLGEEFIEKIEFILTDCEELVSWELELETRLNDKTNLIENQKQTLQLTYEQVQKTTDFFNNLKNSPALETNKTLIQRHETIQQQEQEQLQAEILQKNYLQNQLNKVEEIVQQTAQIQIPPK